MGHQTKFLVRTASGTDEKPTKSATREKYMYIDILWFSSIERLKQYGQLDWLEEGENHRVIEVEGEPHVARDREEEGWFIELETPSDFGTLIDTVGNAIVLDREHSLSGDMAITIYDDYMD
jgi:hypothetical protein